MGCLELCTIKNAAETKLINISKKQKPKAEDLKDTVLFCLKTLHVILADESLVAGIRESNLEKKNLEDYQGTEKTQLLLLLLQVAFLSATMRVMKPMTIKGLLPQLLVDVIGFTKNSKN